MRTAIAAFVSLLATGPGARAGEGIRVGAEMPLSPPASARPLQATPAVAFGRQVYLAVWREGWHGEGGRARIRAARLDASGKLLDPQSIEVAPCKAGVQERPRVAFAGGVFLVVWQDLRNGRDYDVLAARVSGAGKVLDAEPIALGAGKDNQAVPDVASDGSTFLAVWQGVVRDDGVPAYYSFAAPVPAKGAAGKATRLTKHPRPLVAWNGRTYLMVVAQTLVGRRLDADGRPLDVKDLTIVRSAGQRRRTRAIAGAAGKWLVIAERSQPDYWGWGGPGAIQCKLVEADGTLAEDLARYIRTLPGNERNTRKYRRYDDWLDVGESKQRKTWPYGPAAVAWDGKQFVAVWQRHHLERKVMFANCDLLAARVAGWQTRDPDAVAAAASGSEEKWPALASDGTGRLLCVYEKHADDGSVRVTARMLQTQ